MRRTIKVRLTPLEFAALAARCGEMGVPDLDECINKVLEDELRRLLSYRVQFIT